MSQRYRTIVADPPWPYDEGFATSPDRPFPASRSSSSDRRETVVRDVPLPYKSMSLADIKRLPVGSLSVPDISGTTAKRTGLPHDGSVLYLWTTNRYLYDAHDVARAWGFKPTVVLAWCKPSPSGPGQTFASNLEFVVVGRRGSPRPATERVSSRWFVWPRGAHSAKPDAFYDMVERVSPGPYVELFARRARFGWDYWGNQSLGTADMEVA